MAASRRKTPSHPMRAIKPEPIDWETDLEPLRLNSTDEFEVGTIALFYIDDVEYRIPDRFPASLALRYLKRLREVGEEAAVGWMLEDTIGTEAYEALMGYDKLTDENMEHIMKVVSKLLLGSLEAPKGSSSNGSTRSAG
jgi:hypothetical protein